MAVGASQVYDIDYYVMFSPAVKLVSLRMLLAIANEDMVHEPARHENCVLTWRPRERCVHGNDMASQKAYRLLKSIYDLKQSGRTWYQMLDKVLKGFTANGWRQTNVCTFWKIPPTEFSLASKWTTC